MTGPRRARLGLAAAAVLAVVAAGCANPSTTSFGSALSRQRIDNDAVVAMNHVGEPVDWDTVGCHRAFGHELICYGTTSDTPQKTITATFGPPTSGPGCPGTLKVVLGATPVTTERENPCLP